MLKSGDVYWHALYVASRCERVVAAQLSGMGIETCVPVQKQLRRWSDRTKEVEVVLFSNYVFMAASPRQRESLGRLRHVVGYVRFGQEIAILSEREVALIKQISKAEHPVIISNSSLSPGDEVEIISGPLKTLRGHILSTNGTTKVQLAIPSLRSFAQVILEKGQVKKVI